VSAAEWRLGQEEEAHPDQPNVRQNAYAVEMAKKWIDERV